MFASAFKMAEGKRIGCTNYCGIYFLLNKGFLSIHRHDGSKVKFTTKDCIQNVKDKTQASRVKTDPAPFKIEHVFPWLKIDYNYCY